MSSAARDPLITPSSLPCSAKVSPSLEKEMKTELDRVAKQFGGGAGTDMTKFPEIKFSEPSVDGINSSNA